MHHGGISGVYQPCMVSMMHECDTAIVAGGCSLECGRWHEITLLFVERVPREVRALISLQRIKAIVFLLVDHLIANTHVVVIVLLSLWLMPL